MIFPEEYTNRIKQQLGNGFSAFMNSMNEPPYKALRFNRRMTDPADYADLTHMVIGCNDPEEVPSVPGAFYYTDASPGRSALHEAGAYYIQEPSAMLPVTLLDVNDQCLKVLDLCAAPGGKTTQIADCMGGRGLLVANEIIPSRAAILSENIERMGVTNALVISEDPKSLTARFGGYFDRILVDAPCSGEGMFRKNPEAISEWSPDNVAACAQRQDMILDCAAQMLGSGGKIVYSTCTFSSDEDEGTMERFLARHPDFSVSCGPHRIWPHLWRGEGHFAVAFSRDQTFGISLCRADDTTFRNRENGASREKRQKQKHSKNTDRSCMDLLQSFIDEVLSDRCRIKQTTADFPDRLISFGNSIYLAPEVMPDISGLKVLRAGLKLGDFKKNRFEPDHALSHALSPNDVNLSVELDVNDEKTTQYLAGMTTGCDTDVNGWCLVCVNGFALGWGKAGGGIIKNHYPKGLRKSL